MGNGISLWETQRALQEQRLRNCNLLSIKYNLRLTERDIQALTNARFSSLKETGRVEFGEGVLEKLIYAFCDSPYLEQETYAQTLSELQDAFYYFKNETLDFIADDDLIAFMKLHFDGDCEGDVGYLTGSLLEDLGRLIREGEDE
ncbi:MAG TPA: DUF6323 family protein [Clostridia bacterium]|nr:DUF6323 family protein [Clostridia bacterium]